MVEEGWVPGGQKKIEMPAKIGIRTAGLLHPCHALLAWRRCDAAGIAEQG